MSNSELDEKIEYILARIDVNPKIAFSPEHAQILGLTKVIRMCLDRIRELEAFKRECLKGHPNGERLVVQEQTDD